MKTRIRELKDGAQEIIRLLSPEEMEGWSRDDPLSYEKSIVWLCDISKLPFVRARIVDGVMSRRGPIYLGEDVHVVGYSKLTPNAPHSPDSNGYVRRVFYLKASDMDGAARYSQLGLDPRTIFPGVVGEPPRTREIPFIRSSRLLLGSRTEDGSTDQRAEPAPSLRWTGSQFEMRTSGFIR